MKGILPQHTAVIKFTVRGEGGEDYSSHKGWRNVGYILTSQFLGSHARNQQLIKKHTSCKLWQMSWRLRSPPPNTHRNSPTLPSHSLSWERTLYRHPWPFKHKSCDIHKMYIYFYFPELYTYNLKLLYFCTFVYKIHILFVDDLSVCVPFN